MLKRPNTQRVSYAQLKTHSDSRYRDIGEGLENKGKYAVYPPAKTFLELFKEDQSVFIEAANLIRQNYPDLPVWATGGRVYKRYKDRSLHKDYDLMIPRKARVDLSEIKGLLIELGDRLGVKIDVINFEYLPKLEIPPIK